MEELTPQKFRALNLDKIQAMAKNNPEKLAGLIPQMRNLINAQAQKIDERGNLAVAFEHLKENQKNIYEGKVPSNPDMLEKYAKRLLDVYKSRTMTVHGAEEFARKQDAALFGKSKYVTSTGLIYEKINYRMTPEERKNYWILFNTYNEVYGKNYSYKDVWQAMQDEMFEAAAQEGDESIAGILNNLVDTYGGTTNIDTSFLASLDQRLKSANSFNTSKGKKPKK